MKGRIGLILAGAAVVGGAVALMRREGDRPLTIDGARYLRLTTNQSDGTEVSRPVWFVERDGVIEITTPERTGKVAQIAADPRVEVAPCDMRGKVDEDAEHVTGVARIVRDEDSDEIFAAIRAKYGWQARIAEQVYGARRRAGNEMFETSVGLRIVPTERL